MEGLEKIFLQLFLSVWQRSLEVWVVVAAVLLLRLLFRRAPKWTHCLMWGLVAFKLLCPVTITSDFSLMPQWASSVTRLDEVPETVVEEPAVGLAQPAESADHKLTQPSSDGRAAVRPSQPTVQRVDERLPAAVTICGFIWLTGAGVIICGSVISYWRMKRRLAEAIPAGDGLYDSDRIDGAFVFGVVHPKIYLPSGLTWETRREVVSHERAHLWRRDYLTKLMAYALAAAYWFNPAVWLAYGLYCSDMELACDERATRGGSEEQRKAYARALVECSQRRRFTIYNAIPVGFGKVAVKRRVANVLKKKKTAVWLTVAALAAAAVIGVLFVTRQGTLSTDVPDNLDKAVSESIFADNDVSMSDILAGDTTYYYAAVSNFIGRSDCECYGEGHLILGTKQKGNTVDVYALCSAQGYGFRDGKLVDNTGYSAVPTLITFEIDENGDYIYKSRQEAKDGGDFAPSIRQMFPRQIAERAIKAQGIDEIVQDLSFQCDLYAAAYLKKIGRDAKVSSYYLEDFKILSDYGVSSDVSNALLEKHGNYSIYVGTFECIESGRRYVYHQLWDGDNEGNGRVSFFKTDYESGEEVECFVYEVKGNTYRKVILEG